MLLKPSLDIMANYSSPPLFPSLIRRIFAGLVDFILLGLIWYFLEFPFQILATWDAETITFIFKDTDNFILLYLFVIGYFSLMEGVFGFTLGKLIFQEEVLTLRGHKANLLQAIIRNLFKPIDLLLLMGPLLISPKNQTIGDRAAKTIVFRKNAGFPGIIAEDRYLVTFKKIVGFFFLFFSCIILAIGFYFINIYLPRITTVNQATITYFMRIEKGFELNKNFRAAYETASSKLREQVSLEDYQKRLAENPILPLALEKRNEIVFYKWEFKGDNEANIYGTIDEQYEIVVNLHKENSQWKFVSGNVGVIAE